MKKLLTHLLVLTIVRNEKKAQMIIDILYDQTTTVVKEDKTIVTKGNVKNTNTPTNDKKREVMEAIQFLKNKETKTKADREKIQMLEVILKTV
jgi:hypothetical protein